MDELISVIVPVYNVEKYVEQCLQSIIAQTYKNIEIVVIDDGSTDSSGEICDRLAKADSRIAVYHKSNGGVSAARNDGVEKSSGDYIAFVDSDDIIAPTYLEYLCSLIKKTGADIASCSFIKTSDRETEFETISYDGVAVMTGREACCALLTPEYASQLVVVWGKLFRSVIVLDERFPVGRKHEDVAITYKYYYKARTVAIGSCKLYLYYKNANGIMANSANGLNADSIYALNGRIQFFEDMGETQIARMACDRALNIMYACSILDEGCCDNDIAACMRERFHKGLIPLGTFAKCSAYLMMPNAFRKLRTILGRN